MMRLDSMQTITIECSTKTGRAKLAARNRAPKFFIPYPCRILGLAALLICASHAVQPPASAQSGGGYTIKKSTIDSGGGTIAGGDYILTGTAGQHDATPVAGGDYFITGGFWSPAPSAEAPDDVIPDPSGLAKTRFVSFVLPAASSAETAVRVRLASLHHVLPPYTGGPSVPFTGFEGQVRWVGPPTQYVESTSSGIPFLASQLQCTPHYQDWSTVGLLHVTGSAIVPSSNYDVEHLAASCQGAESSCAAVSAPLLVTTTRWGDVENPFNPPSATVQPDVADIGALVNKFRSAVGAPIKSRALLAGAPGSPFGEITHVILDVDFGFSHISACVDAFRGVPYPYTIAACP